MGHGRRAHLLFAETLLDLRYLRSLQSSHLHKYLVQSGSDERHPADHFCMPVALHHLIGDIHFIEAQVAHDPCLDLHAVLSKGCLGSHGAAHLSHGRTGAQLCQPLNMAGNLRGPDGESQAVGGGHGDLAVGPAGADQIPGFHGQVQKQCQQGLQLGLQHVQRGFDLQARGRVQDIVGGRTQVDPFSVFGALLGHGQNRGHHVMADLVLDLFGPFWTGLLGSSRDLSCGPIGDHAQLFLCLREGSLHPEETAQPEILFPDGLHLFGAVPEFDGMNRHGREDE